MNHAELAREILRLIPREGSGAGPQALVQLLNHFQPCVEVRDLPVGFDGRTLKDSSGRHCIEISDAISDEHRNFTLAHELSHLILQEKSDSFPVGVRTRFLKADLEKLCDRMAGQLLVPDLWVRQNANRFRSLEDLEKAASTLRVTTNALAFHLSISCRPMLLVHARYDDGSWVLTRGVGKLRGVSPADVPLIMLGGTPAGMRSLNQDQCREIWQMPSRVIGSITRGGHQATLFFAHDSRTPDMVS